MSDWARRARAEAGKPERSLNKSILLVKLANVIDSLERERHPGLVVLNGSQASLMVPRNDEDGI